MDKPVPGAGGERGSSKIFSIEAHDHEKMAHALGVAKAQYQVKRWWKYGQPAIDLIKGTLEVAPEQLGSTVSGLMKLNGSEMQVKATCFPNGIPVPEVFQIDVEIAAKVG
jgi:hypothetical protein